jgi:hypothetical protein
MFVKRGAKGVSRKAGVADTPDQRPRKPFPRLKRLLESLTLVFRLGTSPSKRNRQCAYHTGEYNIMEEAALVVSVICDAYDKIIGNQAGKS